MCFAGSVSASLLLLCTCTQGLTGGLVAGCSEGRGCTPAVADDPANPFPLWISQTACALIVLHAVMQPVPQDIFDDSDEEEMDFDDVVRHCTSECHALFHLRQVRGGGRGWAVVG